MIQTLRTYPLMMTWSFLSYKPWMVLRSVVQIMTMAGFVIGISFLFTDITPPIARYLITGTPTIILMMMGLVTVPQMVAYGRLQGTYDFMRSLPVPRMVLLASDATIYFLLILPAIFIAIIIGSIYHDFPLQVSPLVVPAFIMISLTGSFIGYALALAVPNPRMAIIATQVLLLIVAFFSPVIFPVEQLPGWLAAIHNVLPIKHMANLTRGTLTNLDINLGLAFTVTGAWCAASYLFCYVTMKKRG